MENSTKGLEKALGTGTWLLVNVLFVVLIPVAIWGAKLIIGFNIRIQDLAPDFLAITSSVLINILVYVLECMGMIGKEHENTAKFTALISVLGAIIAYIFYAVLFGENVSKASLLYVVLIACVGFIICSAFLGAKIRKAYQEDTVQKSAPKQKKSKNKKR